MPFHYTIENKNFQEGMKQIRADILKENTLGGSYERQSGFKRAGTGTAGGAGL